jgi:hypothetical protein
MSYRALHNRLNGRLTAGRKSFSYEDAKPQYGSNHWSVTENNRNNARNVNFNNGNTNNNNKYNSNVVRPVAALGDAVPTPFLLSVWEAYHDCLRGKMTSAQAVEYMEIAESDIPVLAHELWTGTYQPGTSTCFLVRYPKWREVFAACFRDRIVHHWICLRLEPLFELRFREQGNVSFNCRKGFGTEKAVEHVAEAMRSVSDNYYKPAWVFRGDIVGFFMSINKELLWCLLERFMRRWRFREQHFGWERYGLTGQPEMYWDILFRVTRTIAMHHPEQNCVLNSPVHLWKNLAPNKSLFTSSTGESIGNLTTQLFANFLMSFFVAYAQFLFRCKRFGMAQFVDDFVLVCDDLRFLVDSIPLLEAFLRDKLLLALHKDKRYLQPVSHGVLFVGTMIKPLRMYLSNRTLSRMAEKCSGFGEYLNGIDADGAPDLTMLERIEQVVNSYLGFTRRRQTYSLRTTIINNMGASFWRYFTVKGRYESIRIRRQYRTIYV